jgi:hypothetical protein
LPARRDGRDFAREKFGARLQPNHPDELLSVMPFQPADVANGMSGVLAMTVALGKAIDGLAKW